jgi:N-acetylmuramoyl-L-alanine amidase
MRYWQRRRWAAFLTAAVVAGAFLLSAPAKVHASPGYGQVSDDVWLLARLIYAEAAGEPYQGKVAVGAVVMNRVRSGIFPWTIPGVIYDPWQFSSVGNWMFNSTPDQESISAAIDAVSGVDPTGGALYYFNYHIVTNSWLWSKPFAARIGNHWFTY